MSKFCLLQAHDGGSGSGDHAADGRMFGTGIEAANIPEDDLRVAIHYRVRGALRAKKAGKLNLNVARHGTGARGLGPCTPREVPSKEIGTSLDPVPRQRLPEKESIFV